MKRFPEGAKRAPVDIFVRFGAYAFRGGDPMKTQDFKPRLTAVFSAGAAGYGLLMGTMKRQR
jgi:hypothetical protein